MCGKISCNSGPFNMSREENISLVENICLEAPESMMKLGELEVPTTKACTLSLSSKFDPPSLFFEESRRECCSYLGFGSTCQFYFSYKISRDDSPYCSMRTCSFLLYSSSSGSSSWSLGAPLETCSCLSLVRWIFRFFLAF